MGLSSDAVRLFLASGPPLPEARNLLRPNIYKV
jgi:hypothetical protein